MKHAMRWAAVLIVIVGGCAATPDPRPERTLHVQDLVYGSRRHETDARSLAEEFEHRRGGPETPLRLGRILIAEGYDTHAAAVLEPAMARFPEEPLLPVLLAASLARLSPPQTERARSTIEAAAAKFTDHPDVLYALGMWRQAARRHEEAAAVLQRAEARASDPRTRIACLLAAAASYRSLGRASEAEQCLRRVATDEELTRWAREEELERIIPGPVFSGSIGGTTHPPIDVRLQQVLREIHSPRKDPP